MHVIFDIWRVKFVSFKISQMFIELATEIALDKEWPSRKDLYWELGFFDYQR